MSNSAIKSSRLNQNILLETQKKNETEKDYVNQFKEEIKRYNQHLEEQPIFGKNRRLF